MKILLTGASGFVGEGVLLECLENPAVEKILMVNRSPSPRKHPKLEERIVPDFFHLDAVASDLDGYDACFYCAGISSSGMSEADYTRITYDTALHFAEVLAKRSPQSVFCHVSGSHADSSEKGRVMWARVKGKAENALVWLPFRKVYNFRPGFMKPTPGQANVKGYYRVIGAMYPVFLALFPNNVSTMREVALAMIHGVLRGYPEAVLEVTDIKALALTSVGVAARPGAA